MSAPRLPRALVILACVAAVLTLGWLGERFYRDAQALRSSPIDNVQWSLSRLEVETLRLRNALIGERAPLADIRRRFDILYSRITLLTEAQMFVQLRADPAIGPKVATLDAFLREATPLIDGPDAELEAARESFAASLSPILTIAATISMEGVPLYAALAERRRAAFERVVLITGLLGLGLILTLAVTLYIIWSGGRVALRNAREASAQRSRMKAVVEVALDPIVVADANGAIIECNEAAAQVFDFAREDALGQEMATLFIPPELQEAHRAGMKRFLADGQPRVIGQGRLELEAVRKSGERFPVELAVGEARDGDGRPIFVGFMRDISQRVAQERELTLARDGAMAADRAKSDFIAVMSHEMRTPLNGVLGVLDLLADTALGPDQTEYVEVATRSGEMLLRQIKDVLDITRIEAGKLEIAEEPIDLDAILTEVTAIGRPGAAANGTRIAFAPPPKLSLASDPHRLGQVLLNLVGNAVKFTQGGSILVEAKQVGETDQMAQIEFSVQDSGIGISREDQQRIFDDFVMLDAEYDRKAAGSGLGLAISKRIVRALGGEIGVESEPGAGSRFWFRLFLQKTEAAPKVEALSPAKPAPQLALKVLVVEDNDVNRMVAREMLGAAGCQVVEARDGLEGVDAAAAEKFDAIFMDISMPRLDGMAAARRIVEGGGASAATPIIALTAHATPSELAAFRAAGMSECLTKPLRRKTLFALLATLTSEGQSTPTQTPPAEALIDESVLDEMASVLSAEMLNEVLIRAAAEAEVTAEALAGLTDHAELAAAAHKTAGGLALVGGTKAQIALAAVEEAAKRGVRDPAQVAAAKAAISETVAILRELAD